MWKLLVISTFFVATQAANIQNFYGQWVPVLYYPEGAKDRPMCFDVTFEKSPEDVACSCTDGRSLTLVKVTNKLAGNNAEPSQSATIYIMAVDTAAEVEPAFAVSCGECEGYRGAVRSLGDNYFILYLRGQGSLVFAKTVVSKEKLNSVMEAIEDLKGKKGYVECSSETYPQGMTNFHY